MENNLTPLEQLEAIENNVNNLAKNLDIAFFKLFEKYGTSATMINTTNPSFKHWVGRFGTLDSINGCVYLIDSYGKEFHTSYVKRLRLEKGVLVIQTRNSLYSFLMNNEEIVKENIVELEVLNDGQVFYIEEYIKLVSSIINEQNKKGN